MKAELFCICDSASIKDGFLRIEGIHNRKYAPHFPVVLPSLTLAAYIRFDADEEGAHTLTLSLTDLDGKVLAVHAPVELLVQTEPTLTQTWIHWVGTVCNIRLDESNEWLVRLDISGRTVASTLLLVALKPATPSQSDI